MNQAKKVVLIPHWIHETLNRHQLPISEALNFNALRRIVSANDMAGYILLNRHAHHVGVVDPKVQDLVDLPSVLYKTVMAEHMSYLYEVVCPLSDMPQMKEDLQDRLFSPDSRTPQYEDPFNIYDVSPEFVGVVINPGFFTGEAGSDQHVFDLLEAVVKALYVYAPLHEVASTPVFLRYLGLLSKKRIMV